MNVALVGYLCATLFPVWPQLFVVLKPTERVLIRAELFDGLNILRVVVVEDTSHTFDSMARCGHFYYPNLTLRMTKNADQNI